MWLSTTFGASLALALWSAFCWGTWSNAAKAAETFRGHAFPLFYLDYSIAVFLTAAAAFASPLGSGAFFHEVSESWLGGHVLSALGAGAVFNVANVLLVSGIGLVGLAVAFPIGVGMALVLGTLLTFMIDGRGDRAYLFGGVAAACVAILFQVAADRQRQLDQSARDEAAADDAALEPARLSPALESPAAADDREALTPYASADGSTARSRKGVLVCAVSGVLLGLWAPLSAYSMHVDDDGHCEGCLTPYGSSLLFTLAVLLTSPAICAVLLAHPLIGPRAQMRDYLELPVRYHAYGLVGGCLWAAGTIANLLSGDELGFALSYAIGQSAPMVATCWGLLWYREFEGCGARTQLLVGGTFVAYSGAIALVAQSK